VNLIPQWIILPSGEDGPEFPGGERNARTLSLQGTEKNLKELAAGSCTPPGFRIFSGKRVSILEANTMQYSPRIPRFSFSGFLVILAALLPVLFLPGCRRSTTGDLVLPTPQVEEDFSSAGDRDATATTAAWTLGGQSGLFSTNGYGGNGADGALDLQGQLTLTSGDDPNRPPDSDGVVGWNFSNLHVAAGATLMLKGSMPIRLNVVGDCILEGTVDASGQNGLNAPAGKASQVGLISGGAAGPGGGVGGSANTSPTNPIGALPMELRGGPGKPKAQTCGDFNRSENRLITVIEPNCGGGTGGNRGLPSGTILRSGCSGNGGAHATDGTQTDYLCSNIGAFGRDCGLCWIVATGAYGVEAPTAGTGGGAGGNAALTLGNPSPADDCVAGSGGGAGGGVEIVSAGTLTVKSSARFLVNGGNGGAGHTTVVNTTTIHGGFGGGGAGGSLWLSGTSVVTETGAILSAVGGTGNPSPPAPTRSGNGGDGYVIVRDLGGTPSVSSTNTPVPVPGRETYAPAGNGASLAVSRWYDSGTQNPQWAFNASNPLTGLVIQGTHLTFANPPVSGQTVTIDFQGAPEVSGQPDPDPTHWLPAGNTLQNPYAAFEMDITRLRSQNLRFLRFRITFDIGQRQKGQPAPNQVVINRVVILY